MFTWLNKKQSTEGKDKQDESLSDIQRAMRAAFYDDSPKEPLSEIARLLSPKKKAHCLYKELAARGQEKGWIEDRNRYPLMYELLYSATDTAIAVDWRMRKRVVNDDKDCSGALTLSLVWAAYVAMADVYLCKKDWTALRTRGLVYMIEDVCGFDSVDDYVVKELNFHDAEELQKHLLDISERAKQPFIESASPAKPIQRQESLTAMYFYGMALAMQQLQIL